MLNIFKGLLRFIKTLIIILDRDPSVSIISTIRFNFHYLPFQQAVLLPIWLYNARVLEMRGGNYYKLTCWVWNDKTRKIMYSNVSR